MANDSILAASKFLPMDMVGLWEEEVVLLTLIAIIKAEEELEEVIPKAMHDITTLIETQTCSVTSKTTGHSEPLEILCSEKWKYAQMTISAGYSFSVGTLPQLKKHQELLDALRSTQLTMDKLLVGAQLLLILFILIMNIMACFERVDWQ